QKPHGDPIAISESIAQICVPGIAIDLVFNNTENTPQDQMSVVRRRTTRDRFAEAPEFRNGIAIPPDLDEIDPRFTRRIISPHIQKDFHFWPGCADPSQLK